MRRTLDKIIVSLQKAIYTIDNKAQTIHDAEVIKVSELLKKGWKRGNIETSRYMLFEKGANYFVFDRTTHKIAVEYIDDKLHEKAQQQIKIEYLK